MKIKNLILGGAAFCLAAGAAVASVAVNPIYIQRVVGTTTPANYRVINQNLCTASGTANCTVAVTIAGTATTRIAYPSAGSTVSLKSTSAVQNPNPPVEFD